MAQLRNVTMILVVLVSLLQGTEAEDYTVGGDAIGWTSFPPGGASFYSKWAANLTFKVNDTLVFKFESGSHGVAILTKANYDKCKVENNIQNYDIGPARVTLYRTGNFYFSCIFSGHCSSGQKLSVKVTSSSSPSQGKAPPPAQGPSTSPSNEEGGAAAAIAPPPQGSATPLASSTFSLLLMTTIAFYFLFQF